MKYWFEGSPVQADVDGSENLGALGHWFEGTPVALIILSVSSYTGNIAQTLPFLSMDAFGSLPSVFTFSDFNRDDFVDWGEETYSSYLDVGWTIPSDFNTKKWVTYLYMFLKTSDQIVTDQFGAIVTDVNGDVVYVKINSLMMSSGWDWSDVSTADLSQVYRFRPDYLTSVSRERIRGDGKAVQLHFESEDNLDFDLLGWGLYLQTNTKT